MRTSSDTPRMGNRAAVDAIMEFIQLGLVFDWKTKLKEEMFE